MPSGVVPLLTAAKYGKDQIAQGVIETIIQGSPFLEQLPWMTFAGNALQKRVEGTLPQASFRQVNATYTKYHGSDEVEYWGVAIMGGEYGVDNFEVDVIANERDLEADQIAKLAKATSMRFDYEVLNGTGGTTGFKGFKQLITDGKGQTVTQAAGALTLAKLDEVIDAFRNHPRPDAFLVNRTHRRKITNLARTTVTGVSLIDVGTDVFGRKVNMYDDVPLRILEDGLDGSGTVGALLPFTEASSTSSIYAVKFGKDAVCGLMGKGGSLTVKRFGELEASPQRMGRLEWYPGIASFDYYGLVRYENITNA
jgi:hypothetical protein